MTLTHNKEENDLFEARKQIRYLKSVIGRLEAELDFYIWKDVKKKGLPKHVGEYECTVITLDGFHDIGIEAGVRLNVRLIYVNSIWKNQHFEEVPYYKVLAWKEISEPFKGD